MSRDKTKKAGIPGVGNLLLSDESFGIHVIRFLEERYLFPETVTVMDGGTAGIYMAPFLEEHDPVFIVDVLNLDDGVPGSLYTFSVEEGIGNPLMQKMSPHQLGILEILDICRLRGIYPDTVEFFCVVPESMATGLAMSEVVESQVKKTGQLLVERLKKAGYDIDMKREKTEQM